ncbi:MAG: homoserine dehydrogenase [Phycisphaerales bacterium JB039]
MPTTVLKFGSSALRSDADLSCAVDEIYRRTRRGERIIAVVSAIGHATDELAARARMWAPDQGSGSLAHLLSSGETASVGLLGLALERAGVPCEALDARALGIRTRGPICDAEPVSLDRAQLDAALSRAPVVIAPGFVGVDEATGRLSLLGRGGSDLTAVFLAAETGAACALIKDVDGVYSSDPNATIGATRYERISWRRAERVGAGLVQFKALCFAERAGIEIEVTSFAPARSTIVGAGPDRIWTGLRDRRPLRVALLGRGVVGAGVYDRLLSRPDLFELVAVAVRRPERHADIVPPDLLVSDPWEAIRRDSDLVIELIGGTEPAGELIEGALRRARHVVTANKALIAQRGADLEAIAGQHDRTLLFSGAVGGSTPAIDLVDATAADSPITRIEGVLNGTTSFVLDEIARGCDFAEAVAEAQRRGYAEADPSLDISGEDLRHKVQILARRAWGDGPIVFARRTGLGGVDETWVRAQRAQGRIVRLVGAAWQKGGRIVASTTLRALAATDPLGSVTGAGNALTVTCADGSVRPARGVGAGRWPTTAAVFADLLDIAAGAPRPRDLLPGARASRPREFAVAEVEAYAAAQPATARQEVAR